MDSATSSPASGEVLELLSVDLLQQHQELVASFRHLAQSLDLVIGWHYLLDLAWIVSQIPNPSGMTILDAGAGTGLLQWWLAERGARVISVDRVPRKSLPVPFHERFRISGLQPTDWPVSTPRDLPPAPSTGEVIFHTHDLTDLSAIETGSVDAVVSVSALEHNSLEGLRDSVRELERMLRPEGLFLATISASNRSDWYHEPSKGWCLTETSLRQYFGLPDAPSNFAHLDHIFSALRECAELRENLHPFYFQSGDNGMPWGVWDPRYQPVGIRKVKSVVGEPRHLLNESRRMQPSLPETPPDPVSDRLPTDSLESVLASSNERLAQYKDKHRGQRCVIIGNGPSLNRMDLSFLKHEITFGLNRIYLLADKWNFTPTYYVSVNSLVIEQSAEEILKIPAPRFLGCNGLPYIQDPSQAIFLRSLPKWFFAKDPRNGICEGYTVTYVALQLAYFMGFSEAVLIGVDHHFATAGQPNQEVVSSGDDPNHFHPDYFGKGVRWHLPDLQNSEVAYRLAKQAFEADGRRILDATVNGRLTVFPKVDYRDTCFSPATLRADPELTPGAQTLEHLQEADSALVRGDLSAARDALERALSLTPDDPQLIVAHGNILLRLGDVEAARREFLKATVLHPDCARAHADLAAALMQLGHPREAEGAARRALALNPADTDALKLLARLFLESGRCTEAVQAYVTILRQTPGDLETMLTVGNCYAEAGRLDDAKIFYQRVLQLDPGNSVAAENLAVVEQQQQPEQLSEAASADSRCLKPSQAPKRSDTIHVFRKRAERYLAQGNFTAAQDEIRQALDLAPDDPELIVALGNVLLQRGDTEAARREFVKATVLAPDHAMAHGLSGLVLVYLRRYEEAETSLRRALAISPNEVNLQTWLETLDRSRRGARPADEVKRDTDIQWPLVSVVTPSFNQAEFIEQTIQSVLTQKYPNVEHIVIDGGSTDGTVDILTRYRHLKWVSESDSGQSEALNKGLRMARGEIVAWINSDDWYEPGMFEAIATFFMANPEKNVVMGNCNLVDEKGSMFDTVINTERGFDELKQYWVARSIPTQAAIFFRRKLLDEYGYMDESLHYAMDYDLWMRFAQDNRFYHLDLTVANYRFHPTSKGGDQDWSKFLPEWNSVYNKYVASQHVPRLVSVIIPCYNYARYLPDAVGSVLAQTHQDFEIIIVDDGSTDDTQQVAEQLVTAHSNHHIRVILQQNSGQPAISRNRGISEARGEYILCLDADDMIAPTMLEECVRVLEANPDISIAYTDQQYFGDGPARRVETLEYDFDRLAQSNFMGYCSLYRRRAWEDVGGYRTNVKGYEDWDFWITCGEKRHVGRRIPKPLFQYRQHDGGLYADAVKRDQQLKAQIVLNHPKVYDEGTVARARDVQRSTATPATATKPPVASGQIVAIIAAYNEGDVIYHVIGDLIANGVNVYLIDNNSTDNTVAEASRWLGKGLLHIERFPQDSGYPERDGREYVWRDLLRRKEELAGQLGADWYIHHDADEFRESPWPGMTLAEAIRYVDSLGFTAITFEVLTFRPTDDGFVPGTDVREHLTHYEAGEIHDALQVKAWKNLGQPVQLARMAGHVVEFPGRRICPVPFLLRHYPIRGETHGQRKVFVERVPRFAPEERAMGWHIQYNSLASGRAQYVRDPSTLTRYDGTTVRANILARVTRDLLLMKALGGPQASPEGNALDGHAVSAWVGRALNLPQPVPMTTIQRADETLKSLLAAMDRHHGQLTIPVTSEAVPLLLAVAKIKAANASLIGDGMTCKQLISLSEQLAGAHAAGPRPSKEGQMTEDGKARATSAARGGWPEPVVGYVRQADEHFARGDLAAARYYLSQALSLAPDDPELLVISGNLLLSQGDVEAARDQFVKATVLAPDCASAHLNLAGAYLHLGRPGEAEASVGRALALDPADTDALKLLARLCLDSGRYIEAVQAYLTILRHAPDDVETLLIVGNCYAEAGRPEDATTFYQRVLQLEPGNVIAAENLSVVSNKGTPSSETATTASPAAKQEPVAVSIVIPVFNHLGLTRQCLDALRDNTTGVAYEVIVVDNGSSDGTTDVLRQEEASGRVRAVFNGENQSFAKACNQGARIAHGRYLLFLNNDTVPHPGWLAPLVQMADANSQIGVLGSKLLYPDGTIQHAGIVVGVRDGEPYPYHIYLCQPANTPYADSVREFQMVTGACLMIRRPLSEQLGGFDETFHNGHEDLDLCLRVRQAGSTVVYCPQSVVTHLESRTKRLIGLENFHYRKGVENEESRGRHRFLDKWRSLLDIDDQRYYAEDGTSRQAESAPTRASEMGGPMHVLFTMYGWADVGGGTILPRQVAKALARRGHQVTVVYTAAQRRPDRPAYYVEERREEGIHLFGIYNRPALFYDLAHPEREMDDPHMRQIVARLMTDLRPDIVHYHSLLNFSMGIVEDISRAGVPSVYTSHNYWPLCPRMYLFREDLTLCSGPSVDGSKCAACVGQLDKHGGYAQRVERGRHMLNHLIDRHLAVSHRLRELFIQNGHDAGRIQVLHQQPETVEWIWRQVGASRQPEARLTRSLRVGFIGGLLPQKGAHVLVKALQAFRPDDIEGHIFGSGPSSYVNALQQIDGKGLVRFHGRYELDQLPRILAGVDLVVVPSVWEDCAPLVVAEAMAARCPVIGSRIGGIPDFIKEGVDGVLCDARDSDSLARAVGRFVTDPALLGWMQRNIQPPKGFDAYLDELITHYHQVIADHSRHGGLPFRRPVAGHDVAVIWEGSQLVHHSLALINRELCIRLAQDNSIELSILPYEPDQFGPEADPRFEQIVRRVHRPLSRPADVHVRHQWPPNLTPPPEGHWVMIQPWEFGSLPKQWVDVMRSKVDEIWVPSSYVRECYIRSGVPADRVYVVPNGVDARRFRPDIPPLELATRKHFRFLFVGGTIWRKGPDVLLDAYLRTFTAEDDVCLVIKDMGGDSFYKGQSLAEQIRQHQADPRAPEILYLTQDMPPNDLPRLYAACNCLVHPYRGEGFGLPIAEAMACGLPVIVTGAGACLDFCDAAVAYLVPAGHHRLPEKRIGQWETVDVPFLYEPDRDVTARLMRHVFENPEEAHTVGARARERIRDQFSWDHAVQRVGERVRALSDRPVRRLQAEPVAALATVIAADGHELAPLWSSLVHCTHHPLAVTIVRSRGNGGGADAHLASGSPEGWRMETSDVQPAQLLNNALRSCGDGPIILLLGDVILTPGWLKRLLAALDRDQQIAAVGPTSNHAPTPQRVKADYKGTGKALRQFAIRQAHRHARQLKHVSSLAPFCLVFKSGACRQIGLFREDLDLSASLGDYFSRLQQAGYTLAVAFGAYVHRERLWADGDVTNGETAEAAAVAPPARTQGHTPVRIQDAEPARASSRASSRPGNRG
jgi:glycosyltransferase involved in cell wall biosynthesis/tetratricopeptide (TPR) repeat protein/SAM-dependent methyltransferase